MSFDSLFTGREKISDSEYRVSSAKRVSLIIPKGMKVFDEGTLTWYVGDGSTQGGIELADTAGGAILGNLTGSVTGNVTGNVVGNVAGVVVGSLIGDTFIEPLAGGAIPANRLVQIDQTDATFVVGTVDSLNVVGVNKDNVGAVEGGNVRTAQGVSNVVTATPVKAGTKIKCADNGRVTQLVTDAIAGSTIVTGTGVSFTNQPTNDGVTVVSDDAADTTQTVTIIGTTHGGIVLSSETVTLNGTTAVNTTKTDWGNIVGIKLSAQTAGTLTVKETSGGATIIAVSGGLGTVNIGVYPVAAASQGSFNVKPRIVASGASTMVVGIRTIATDGTTVALDSVNLNGTTSVEFATARSLVTELYMGAVANPTTATLSVGTTEYLGRCVGKALTGATAAGATIQAFITT
jgi:hypothetical protein